MRPSVVLASALLTLSAPAQAGFFFGSELKRMCSEGIADQYVAGVYDAFESVKDFGTLSFEICIPPDSKMSDLTKMACDYVDANSDALEASASIAVAASLIEAYRCP